MNKIHIKSADLNLLGVFQALMEERHVGRAAFRMGRTQSAVSHALARLRVVLGDPLFVRHPKGIQPTPRALELAPDVADVLERARALLSAAQAFDPTRPHRFTVGAADIGVFTVLQPLMRRLRDIAPAIDLKVRPIDSVGAIPAFDRQEIDVALVPHPSPPARITRVPALHDRFVGIARRGHPDIVGRSVTMETFAKLPFLLVSPQGRESSETDARLAECGLRRRIVMGVPHFLSAPMLVASTDLVAVVSERVALYFATQLNLVVFEPPIPLQGLTIDVLTSRARAEDRALRWLSEQILTACSEPFISSGESLREPVS